MGQILHGSAKTTHAVRAAIQRSNASIQELASCLQHRVTQLPAENLWHVERSTIGLFLFLRERPAIAELQKTELADGLVEVGPNATPFAASLLEERMECEDFIPIHRIVVRGQSPPMLRCQLSDADGLATVAEGDIADEAAEHVESIVRQVDSCSDLARDHLWLPLHQHFSSQPRRRGLALELAKETAVAFQWFFLWKPWRLSYPGWTVQLWRINALDADRQLSAGFYDVFSGDLRSLKDASTTKSLPGPVCAELETIHIGDDRSGISVRFSVRTKLRKIDRAAYPQKSFHRSHDVGPPWRYPTSTMPRRSPQFKKKPAWNELIIELLKLLGVIAPFANAPEACALPSVRP